MRSTSYRKVVQDSSPSGASRRRRWRRRIEHALSASRPHARYLVGLDAQVQARLKLVIPTPIFDWVVARMMGLRSRPSRFLSASAYTGPKAD